MNENTSNRSIGATPIFLALACLLLLLFGAWQTQVMVSPPGVLLRFDWYHFLPVVLGAVSIALSVFWCFKPPVFSGLKGYMPLLGPVLCLLSVGLVALIGAHGFEETTLAHVEPTDLPAPFVAGALFIRAQAIGFLWAALSLFAAALSVTAVGRFGIGGKSRGRLPWVWVTVGLIGAFDLILIRSPWWNKWGRLVEANPFRRALAFDGNTSALVPDAWPVCAPFALGVLLVAVFPMFLLRLDRVVIESRSRVQMIAVYGYLGGCFCLTQALSARSSGDILLSLKHLLVKGELSKDYWSFHEISLGTSWLGEFPTKALPVIGLFVCALFLYRVRGTVKKALGPLVFGVGLLVLGIALVRIAALSHSSLLETERCDCCSAKLMSELSSGGLDLERECLPWAYWTSQYRDLDLPVLDAGESVKEQFWARMPIVSLNSHIVKVNYREFVLPEEGALASDSSERNEDHSFVIELNAVIKEYTEKLDMVAARMGQPPKIDSVVFAVEPNVPEDLVWRVRRITEEVGLVQGFFLVRSPSECGGVCRELRVVKAPDMMEAGSPSLSPRPLAQALRDRLE